MLRSMFSGTISGIGSSATSASGIRTASVVSLTMAGSMASSSAIAMRPSFISSGREL